MDKYICKLCNFSTHIKTNYTKHILTKKHIANNKKKVSEENKIKYDRRKMRENKLGETPDVNTNDISGNIMATIMELSKKIEQLEKSNQELKDANNQNTNKIVKEARSIKKSILTILNTNFKDTPSIDYIKEDEFRIELEKKYDRKINDKESRLFMRIFSDYEKNTFEKTLGDLILKFVKKEDQKEQSVFNIDSSRGNYATKIEDYWLNDKKGLQLKKYTLDVIVGYMINVMDVFRERLADMCEKNRKERNDSVTEYILKYRGLLLDVNAYLTNSNAHKKIILYMCPELRMDDKVLLAITEK
jgi:hypothetical protein